MNTPAANKVRCHCLLRSQNYATTRFLALGSTPPRVNRGDRLERRPPVGTARRRRANHVLPTGGMFRTCTTAPAEVPVAVRTTPLFKVRLVRCAARSGADQRSAFPCLRVALHGGVRPRLAPSVTPAANRVRCHCFLRAQQYATTRKIAGTAWNADLRSAPPAGGGRTTYRQPAGCPEPAPLPLLKYPLPYGPPRCSRSVSFAALRAAVPTRGRRSLACASPCQTEVGDRAALSSRAGCAGGPIMRVSPGGDSSLARLVSRAPRRSRRSRHFAHRLLVSASTQSPARARTPGAPPRRPPAASRRSPGASR